MKKKFFQILLMGAVTVSLGMFVSCKDTYSDLYKQLELKIEGNTSIEEVARMQKEQMEQMKKYVQDQLALIKQCNCPENMSETIEKLSQFVDKMEEASVSDNKSLETLKDLLQGITENYQTVNNFFNNIGVSEAELNEAVRLLEEKIDAIDKCQCDLTKISQIEQTANSAYQLATDANSKIQTATTIANNAKTAADQAISQVKTAIEKADSAKTMAKEASDLVNSLKEVAEAADKLSKENKDKIAANTQAISNIKVQLVAMSDSLKHAYVTADTAYAQAFANKVAIELMEKTVHDNDSVLKVLNNTTIPALKGSVTELYEKVDSLGGEVDDLKDEITKLYAYADANLEKAKAYTDLEIALVRADLANANVNVQDLRDYLDDQVDDLWAEIVKLQQKDVEISETLQAYKDSTDQKIDKALADIVNANKAIDLINDSLGVLEAKIDGNTTKISDLETKLQTAMDEFQEKIDSLQAQIDSLGVCVAKNTEDIQKLTGEFDILQENLKRQVTGILVQGTYNPAFGTLNLPIGVQSNVLLTYYGEATQAVYFPTARTANYVDDKYALTTKDMNILGLSDDTPIFNAGDVILQNEESNAGTLFLTVNPNTVDFSKLQLSLVNSQDHESYIKLDGLKRSDRILQLGYSRAADNGFYECTANLAAEDVNKVQKINFNTSSIKDAIREIVNKRTSADVTKIASDMADVIKGLRIDANAVKCEWSDSAKAGETAKKHAVYSNYNLAATAVKPLSLQTAKDFHYQTVPGYERAMSLLDSLSREAKSKVHVVFKEFNGNGMVKKIANLQIKSISVPDLSDDLLQQFVLHMDTTFIMDGLSYTLDLHETVNVPVKFTKDVNVPISIDQEVAIDLSNVMVETPTILVETDVQSSSGEATLAVPVKDNNQNIIGNAYVDLDDIKVDATASIKGGSIKLNGNAVAHIQYNKDQTVTISVDESFPATFDFTKTLYFGDNGTDKKSFNLVFNYDMRKAATDLWGVAQNSLGDVNDMLDDIRDIVSEVNTTLEKINTYEEKIDNTIDNYIDKVASYIKKFNTKIVNFVNNTNSRLQPTLIASDGTGTKLLSQAKNYPTKMKAGVISLVPTTWTLELAVPLAKKHVAVVNVFKGNKSAQGGDANCKDELNRANGGYNMNNVLSGEIRRAYVTLNSGYTYVIAYSALDFHGKIATRKYYVTIE